MNLASRTTICSKKGFTMIEVIVVIALIAIMVAIAVPPFLQWRQTVEYRDTARAIASLLRNAQSRTVTENFQHRVEIDTAVLPFRRYRMTRGDQSANSTPGSWSLVGCNFCVDWTLIPTSVTLLRAGLIVNAGPPTNESINFNSDGTAALAGTATINVRDDMGITRFTIDVTRVGRVSVRSGP